MKRILFVIVLAALLIASTGAASAGTTRIYFTGIDKCTEDSLNFGKEWMAGPNYQARDVTQVCYDTASIPQLNGIEYIDFNVVGRPFILTGKDRMVTDEGGVWVGSFVWPANTWTIKIIMHGEGMYTGQQLHMFVNTQDDTFWGYIEDTGR